MLNPVGSQFKRVPYIPRDRHPMEINPVLNNMPTWCFPFILIIRLILKPT